MVPVSNDPTEQVVAKGAHVAALTGLRGFAVLAVVTVHASAVTDYPWLGLHTYGPISLFVLSGFLLFPPWSRWLLGMADKPSVATFAWRRVWRIFPAYLVTFALVTLLYPPSRPSGAAGWLRSLTLTQTFTPGGLTAGMQHVWSMGTELTWYAVLPLAALGSIALARRFDARPARAITGLLLLAALVTAAWRWMLSLDARTADELLTWSFWFPAYAVCFFAGAWISHQVVAVAPTGPRSRRHGAVLRFAQRPRLVLAIALLAAGIANSPWGGGWGWSLDSNTQRTVRFLFTVALALALLAGIGGAQPGTALSRAFSAPWLVAIGRWSYGIYLWHLPVREILLDQMTPPPSVIGVVVWLAVQFAVSVPLGAATYAFVEKPTIAFARRVRRGR